MDISNPNKVHNTHFINVKVPLKKILKYPQTLMPKFEVAIQITNQFAQRAYEFIKLFIIHNHKNSDTIPIISKSLLVNIFNLIGKNKGPCGRPSKYKNDAFVKFYQDIFANIYPDKLCKSNLSYILKQLQNEIITCLETNLKTHFIDYLNKYINIIHRDPAKKVIQSLQMNKEDRRQAYYALNQEIKAIKIDLINCQTQLSLPKYHNWLQEQIKILFPFKFVKSISYDVKVSPQKYLASALYINIQIEKMGMKPYQVIPQRKDLVPRHITLNTSGLIEVIGDHQKEIYSFGYTQMLTNIKKYQKHAWQEILKLENKRIFKRKGYIFYNQIQTDGFSASLLFIREDLYYKTYGQKLPDDQDESTMDIQKLQDLTKEECLALQNLKLIGIDPGKKDLVTMVDQKGNFYSYSNYRRRFETYARRSQEILQQEKTKHDMIRIEGQLSQESGRTYLSSKFEKYLIVTRDLMVDLQAFYQMPIWRKLAFRRFSRTKSAEALMLNEIEKKFGPKDQLLLGLGDWSNHQSKQMRGCLPSLTKGIYRLLIQRFRILEVNEFRTSKLYCKDRSQVLVNLKVNKRPIHSLLTLQGKPNGVIVNRDVNACQNMLYLLESYLKFQTRPAEFVRQGEFKMV
jgi:hypothetical protein